MRTLLIASQGLRGTPVRSILVIVALTLGMLGFVAVLTANQVEQQTLTQKAILTGGMPATVELTITGPRSEAQAVQAGRQLGRRLGADAVAAFVQDENVTVWSQSKILDDVDVTFATPSLTSVRPFPQASGAWLSDRAFAAPRVEVNEKAAKTLGARHGLSLGTSDTRLRFTIVGVVRDGSDDAHVYVPASDYALFSDDSPVWHLQLHAPQLNDDDAIAAAHTLTGLGAPFELGDAHRTDTVDELSAELDSTTRVLLVLGALGLASTIVGILNVGLATASGRSKEFALRRTLGASRGGIALIVMVESQLLAIVSALVAFAGSFLLFPVVVGAFGAQLGVAVPAYDPRYGVVCLVIASLTAAVSSLVPALLSYRRDLSSVMRE